VYIGTFEDELEIVLPPRRNDQLNGIQLEVKEE